MHNRDEATSTHVIRKLLASCFLFLAACQTVEETGRSQLAIFGDDYMTEMGVAAFGEATKDFRTLTGTAQSRMLERVGKRIATACGRKYEWEFKLLDAPKEVNAFCLPGGKIAVYTGILPITLNEDGLAIVLGHEVAHATSSHGNERISQGIIAELGLVGVAAALEFTKLDDTAKGLIVAGLGVATNLAVLLPFSREHESEADEIGLLFAIRAGYDPEEGPRLWERMAKLGGGGPTFLSTHPNSEDRAQRLRELIPLMKQRVAQERAGTYVPQK